MTFVYPLRPEDFDCQLGRAHREILAFHSAFRPRISSPVCSEFRALSEKHVGSVIALTRVHHDLRLRVSSSSVQHSITSLAGATSYEWAHSFDWKARSPKVA